MSDSDVGDQQMLITVLINFQNFVDISTCGWCLVHERFPLSSSSSFAFNHPGQCNGFQLILYHNMTHKSDLPANNHLQEIPWRVGSLKNLILDTLSVHAIRNIRRKSHISAASNCDSIVLLIIQLSHSYNKVDHK